MGSTESVVAGAATRGVLGQNPFDPRSMATDLLLGGGTGAAGGALGARAANGPGRPYQTANLGPRTLGETDWGGNITVNQGLSPQDLAETLRHETIHAALTPPGPLQNLRAQAYSNSHLYRYGEEAIAESYATGSVTHGLKFPLTNGYVTPGRLGLEAAGAGTVVGGAAFGVHEAATR
jgi:hypothetical protein